MPKQKVQMLIRDVPTDVHERIVLEKARLELKTGQTASNPQAIFSLIRRSPKDKPK